MMQGEDNKIDGISVNHHEPSLQSADISTCIQEDACGPAAHGDSLEDIERGASRDLHDDESERDDSDIPQRAIARLGSYVRTLYWTNQFVIHIILAILLARAYPPLGAVYVRPQITATWIAVGVIFVIAGLGLRTAELANAVGRVRLNGLVFFLNFFVVSATMFGATRGLVAIGALNPVLADGMVICGCLPIAINAAIVLTGSAGGDSAGAVSNTIIANMIGIFLSPVLILLYLGKSGNVDLMQIILKLIKQVVTPLGVGQILQLLSSRVRELCLKYKAAMKKTQESCLVFIVYTVFCKKFKSKGGDASVGIGSVFLMLLYQLILMLGFKAAFWTLLRKLFPDDPEGVVMGLFCSMQKTIALGVPLIASMYGNTPQAALYTLPILIWHPMQTVIGSILVPRLQSFIQRERARLDVRVSEHEARRLESSEAAGPTDDNPVIPEVALPSSNVDGK